MSSTDKRYTIEHTVRKYLAGRLGELFAYQDRQLAHTVTQYLSNKISSK